jgi:predicted component of type VI protein secretion system
MPLLLRIAGPTDPNGPDLNAPGRHGPDPNGSGADLAGRLVEVDTALRVGRAADNDLVLPDAERVLSKLHCIIRREAGRYVLLDCSANGTFLNDSHDRLARDQAVPLTAGDAVHLGAFTLSVVSVIIPDEGGNPGDSGASLLGPVSHAPVAAPASQPWASPRTLHDLDSFLDGVSQTPPGGHEDFLGEHEAEAWHATPVELQPREVAADPDHTAPDAEAFPGPRPHKEAIPDDWDPLAEIGAAAWRPDAASFDRHAPDMARPEGHVPGAPASGGSQPEAGHPDAAHPALSPPGLPLPGLPHPGLAGVGLAPPGPVSFDAEKPAASTGSPPLEGPAFHEAHVNGPQFNNAHGEPPSAASAASVGGRDHLSARAGVRDYTPARAGGREDTSARAGGREDTSARAGGREDTSARAGGREDRSARAGGRDDNRRAVDPLLIACGLDPATLSDERALVAAERAGHILRIAVGGMLQILGSRSVAKQEFGMQRTAISRGANNVMKFVNTAEEALQMLLCNDLPGFLPAEDAMRETITDINSHHLALLSGVRAAFVDSVRRLDPALIEQGVPSHATDSLMPMRRKARAWEVFRAQYAELERSLAGDGLDIFGSEFARAYASIQAATARTRDGDAERPRDAPNAERPRDAPNAERPRDASNAERPHDAPNAERARDGSNAERARDAPSHRDPP